MGITDGFCRYRMLRPKTLEEHRDYLHEIVRLQLWFLARWLEEHPEESFTDALRKRVDIFHKTDANPGNINGELLWDNPDWMKMEEAAEASYGKFRGNPELFEEEAFLVFKDSIDARCARDMADTSERTRYCGSCFRHNDALEPDGTTLCFHIANFLSPASFFDYPDYMKGCFLILLDRAEHLFGATRIATGTWLNGLPRWLEWFPTEWKENMGEPNKNVMWHYGFWGQFITSRQTFNRKYARIFRETGDMPFYPAESSCSIDSMRKHLADKS